MSQTKHQLQLLLHHTTQAMVAAEEAEHLSNTLASDLKTPQIRSVEATLRGVYVNLLDVSETIRGLLKKS